MLSRLSPGSSAPATLEAALARAVTGTVRFDAGYRALYATDASNYRQVPIGVVHPRTPEEVVAAVEACRRFDAPVLSRGAGTSLCGQCCNNAVILDFSRHLNRILEIDPVRRIARVQPGVVLDELRDAAAPHGLTFAPDPATHDHNTLGGMIGNNSCGPHSVMGGKTDDNVLALEVLTYAGERLTLGPTDEAGCARIEAAGGPHAARVRGLRALRERYGDEIRARMPDLPRRVSGYNLDALLPECGFDLARAVVGSEGTCVLVLEATLRLVPRPRCTALLVLGFADVFRAADAVPAVMAHGPVALEGLDERLTQDIRSIALDADNLDLLPAGGGWLMAEFGGDSREQAAQRAQHACEALRGRTTDARVYGEPQQQERIWKVRESGLGATAHVPGQAYTWPGWEDSAVPPERLGGYLRELRALMKRHGYHGDFYGHFGQGCLHTRIDFDLQSAPGIAAYRRFVHEAAALAVRFGGSISGEHGDGQSKAELLPLMYGERLMQAFREFKALWDPGGRMNPGKVVDAPAADRNLRLGTDYAPEPRATHFRYPADAGSFGGAVLRCVGVGACRKKSGTMCPSYMATGEEMHSTRGRARLLFEMQRGDVLRGGWREPAVKEALDLCLSCKACRRECPVDVDIATYKAEFLAHYYRHRLRPPAAYAFGLIDRWGRLGSQVPGIANFLLQREPFAGWLKRAAGIAPQRRMTAFAPEPFTRAFRRRGPSNLQAARKLILWPDTFHNYFHPEVAWAAVRVLEAAGWRVRLPQEGLCCGRALYEFGMVDRARRYLERTLDALGPDLRQGTPIVGLEPACVSVFRVELPELFPNHAQAHRLRTQMLLLAEFLERHAPGLAARHPAREALVHWHCHQRAVLDTTAETALLQRLGLALHQPDSGCCGMAGSFGYERGKYEVSMRCAERVLLPAIRATAPDALLIADGFSCREQVAHATGRRPLHLAQVLERAFTAGAQARP
jgi:FAD/FMN-containing dehydrogenase/Fe-S oxidoreductase